MPATMMKAICKCTVKERTNLPRTCAKRAQSSSQQCWWHSTVSPSAQEFLRKVLLLKPGFLMPLIMVFRHNSFRREYSNSVMSQEKEKKL